MAFNSITEKLKNFKIDEEIILETEKEMLVGRLQNIDVKLNFIVLSSVRDVKHNVLYTSLQLIPVKRIKSLRMAKGEECSFESATEHTKSDSSEDSCSTTENLHIERKDNKPSDPAEMALTPYELQLLQKQIGSIKILNYRGPEYDNAIADIKARNCVALDVEPRRSGRNRKTAIITIATENSVYLFDILSLGKVFEDLKALLRAERPYKAMYNSRLVADHFEHRHNLQINGISDTFVAYCILRKHKQNVQLEDVVAQYFGISKDFFERQEESHVMYSRPLNETFVRNCAKRASLIYKLNECFHKNMLRTYYSQCKHFSRTYADNGDASEVANSIENNDDSGHQYINALDLEDQSL